MLRFSGEPDKKFINSSRLIESDGNSVGSVWDKQTISYALDNQVRLINKARSMARVLYRVQPTREEIDTIYSDLIVYLGRCEDYNAEKFFNSEYTGKIKIDTYVKHCLKICIKRYYSKMFKEQSMYVNIVIGNNEGEELNIIENLKDTRTEEIYNRITLDAVTALKSLEYKRYYYEVDIYYFMYLTGSVRSRIKEEQYETLLNILGLDSKKLRELGKRMVKDEDFRTVMKALTIQDIESSNEVVNELRKYVYGCSRLNNYINNMINEDLYEKQYN